MTEKLKSAGYYRKKVDTLARQLVHFKYLQRWALKLLEEIEGDGIKDETYQKFRDALLKSGADIQGPGHPHIHRVRPPRTPRPPTGDRHKFPTREEIDREVARLSKTLIPHSELGQWEIL